uniref:Uncharacterized protein n=1 Tax=Xiphophorus maculatus TaxID=8083 RepID=A0A3B5Q877_XIPMA
SVSPCYGSIRIKTGFWRNVCQPGPSCPRHPPGVSVVRVSMVRRTERCGVSGPRPCRRPEVLQAARGPAGGLKTCRRPENLQAARGPAGGPRSCGLKTCRRPEALQAARGPAGGPRPCRRPEVLQAARAPAGGLKTCRRPEVLPGCCCCCWGCCPGRPAGLPAFRHQMEPFQNQTAETRTAHRSEIR